MFTKRLKHLIFIFLLPVYLYSQFESAFETESPLRLRKIHQIFWIFRKDTAQQKKNLNNLRELAIRYKDDQSLLLCKLMELQVESYPTLALQDIAIDKIQQIIRQASEREFTLIVIHGFMQMGDLLRIFKQSGASLSYYLKVNELLPKVDTNFLPRSLNALDYYLGFTFYRLEDYQRACFFMQRNVIASAILPDTHYKMILHDLLSQIYLKLNNFDSSEYQILKAKNIYLKNDTTSWWFKGWNGIFEGNLAKIQYYKNNYERAIPGLKKAIQITSDANLFDNVSSFGLLLADCYLKLGQTSNAQSLVPLLKYAVYKNGDEKIHEDLYKYLSVLRDKNTSVEEARSLLDSVKFWNYKLKARIDTNAQIEKTMELETLNWKKKEKQLEENIQKQINYRAVLWICLAIILILGCLIIYRKQIQIRFQQKISIDITNQSSQDLAIANEQLFIFKNTLIEKSRKIELLEATKDKNQTDIELNKLKADTILTEVEWDHFKKIFEQIHVGYLSRLNQKFPKLTIAENRFLVLIKLSFNNKEMASTLGVSTGAIRTLKSRLLKKLELDDDFSLEKIVEKI